MAAARWCRSAPFLRHLMSHSLQNSTDYSLTGRIEGPYSYNSNLYTRTSLKTWDDRPYITCPKNDRSSCFSLALEFQAMRSTFPFKVARSRLAFTLIELLVVIAIIGVL